MSTITPLSSIPALGSSTSRQGGRPQEGTPEKGLGDTLKATVIEARANDRYLLDFNGTRILALSRAPLSPGQQLQLQVTSTAPQIELKIVSDVLTVLSGKPLILLGGTIDLSALLSSLQQGSPTLFSQLSPTSGETLGHFSPARLQPILDSGQGGELLQVLFNRLGINLESLLAEGRKEQANSTLKAALLEIAHRFQGAEHIAEQAGKLLATIELYQLARLQLNQDRFLIFPLPFPFVEQGYLLVEQDDQNQEPVRDKREETRFSLHLTMSELGNIRVDFLKNSDGLYIRFHLDSKEKVDFVSDFGDTLKQSITGAELISLAFSDTAGDPAAELVRRLLPRGESILDTKV